MNHKKAKILIVEDSKAIQNLMRKILRIANYESSVAKNGLEAIEILETTYFDCILLDLEMPVMDGITFIETVRNSCNDKKSKIPIIATTGNALDLSSQEFKELGFTDIILKPISFTQLDKVLKKHLSK